MEPTTTTSSTTTPTTNQERAKLSHSTILEIVQHNLYVGANGLLTAYSMLSSPPNRLWDITLRGVPEETPVILVADDDFSSVYAAAANKLFKFEPLSGEPIWQVQISEGSTVLHTLSLSNDVLITGSKGTIYCFNKKTSERLWHTPLRDVDSWDLFSTTSLENELIVIELGDRVVFAGVNGNLFALDLITGKQFWSDPLRWKGFGPLSLLFDAKEKVLYVGLNGWVIAFTQQQHKIEKRNEMRLPGLLLSPEPVALLLHKHQLYIGTKGMSFSVDKTTLEVIWENPLKGTGFGSGQTLCYVTKEVPSEHNNIHARPSVLLTGNNNHVIAMNPDNGNTKWVTALPDISISALHNSSSSGLVTIFTHQHNAFVGCGGDLFGLNLDNGKIEWRDKQDLGGSAVTFCCVCDSTKVRSDHPLFQAIELSSSNVHNNSNM